MTITISELESVKEWHEEALNKSHSMGLYKAITSKEKLLTSLSNSIEGAEVLEKGSLGIKEREIYIRAHISRLHTLFDLLEKENPFSLLGKFGCLTVLQYSRKLIYDLYDGFTTLYKIKQKGENVNFIRKLIQEKDNIIKTYIITHEQEKMENLRRFRENHPYIEKPIIKARGKYPRDIISRCHMVGAFGEYLQPKLYIVNREPEVIQALQDSIREIPLEEGVKRLILKEIRPRVVDEIFSGHPVNLDIFTNRIEDGSIFDLAGVYLYFHGGGCIPFYEWECIYTLIFPLVEVGRATYYSPRAINKKLGYINRISEILNLSRIPYVA